MRRSRAAGVIFVVVFALMASAYVFFQAAKSALEEYAATQCDPYLYAAGLSPNQPANPLSTSKLVGTINLNPTGGFVKASADAPKLDFTYFRSDKYKQFDFKRDEREKTLSEVDAVSIARGLTLRERLVPLETVLQETKGLNPDYGDRGSLGAFQQHSGWGTAAQRKNVEYATNKFIDAFLAGTTKKERATKPIKELAIKIQIPDRKYYDRDWPEYDWDRLGASLVGSKEFKGDASADLMDPELTLSDDGCIPSWCYSGSYTSVDSLRIATWNREYGNSGSMFHAGLLTLARSADIINLQEMGDGSWDVATSLFAKQGFGTVKREFRNAVPIYYNKRKFTYLDSGEDRPARGTHVESGAGGRYFSNKNITWVKLRVKSTGAIVFMINQHLVPSYEKSGRLDPDTPRRAALYEKQMDGLADLVDEFRGDGLVYASADWNFDAEKDEKVKSKSGVRAKLQSMGLFLNWRVLGFAKQKATHAGGRFIDGIAAFTTKAAVPVAQVVGGNFKSDHRQVIVTYKGEAIKGPSSSSGVAYGDPVSQQNPGSKAKAAPTPTPTPSPSDPQAQTPNEQTNDDPACSGRSEGGNKLSGQCLTKKVTVYGESEIGHLQPDARLMVQCAKGYFPSDKFSYTTYNGGVDQSHPSGQAIDIMRNGATTKQGWELAYWLKDHKEELGIWLLIYDHKIWNVERDKEGWRPYSGTSNPHTDHIHAQTWGNKARGMGSGTTVDTSGWGFPLKKNYVVTSPYARLRVNPATGILKIHDGTDYGAPYGAPILAIADGEVTFARAGGGYGNYVTVSHMGGKVISGYAHMSSIAVHKGDEVKRGQIIGYVGATGFAKGAHLHANVRVKGYKGDCDNSHCDWVNFDEFIKNTGGIRDKLLGARTGLRA